MTAGASSLKETLRSMGFSSGFCEEDSGAFLIYCDSYERMLSMICWTVALQGKLRIPSMYSVNEPPMISATCSAFFFKAAGYFSTGDSTARTAGETTSGFGTTTATTAGAGTTTDS